VSDRTAVTAGALVGALVGAAASYLFFTGRGRELRDRIEPAIEELQREFMRFEGTIQQVGRMANEGSRVVQEFMSARSQSQFPAAGHRINNRVP
jgi:gas vesicle protein